MKFKTMLKKLFFLSFLFPIIPILAIPDQEDGEGDAGNNDDEKNDDVDDNNDNDNDSQKDERVIFKSQKDFERTLKRRVDKAIKKTKADEEDKRNKEKMSETEKLRKEIEDSNKKASEAMTRANKRLIRAEVVAKASNLNIIDPAAAYKLIELDDIEIDENNGEISGVEAALKTLIEDKPYLLKTNNQNQGTGGDDQNAGKHKKRSNFSMNAMIRKAAGR